MPAPLPFRYQAVVIDPTDDGRAALRRATVEAFDLARVAECDGFESALQFLAAHPCEAVVVSDAYPEAEALAFEELALTTDGGGWARYYRALRSDSSPYIECHADGYFFELFPD